MCVSKAVSSVPAVRLSSPAATAACRQLAASGCAALTAEQAAWVLWHCETRWYDVACVTAGGLSTKSSSTCWQSICPSCGHSLWWAVQYCTRRYNHYTGGSQSSSFIASPCTTLHPSRAPPASTASCDRNPSASSAALLAVQYKTLCRAGRGARTQICLARTA